MQLKSSDIKHIISALDFQRHRMEEKLQSTQYPDVFEYRERQKHIDEYKNLSLQFKNHINQEIKEGFIAISMTERIQVSELVQIKEFDSTNSLNDFIKESQDRIRVISVQPWLKNHGYSEYLLTYSHAVEVEKKHP